MENYKMAWRNLWRNKSRTFLTAFIVFIVVILSTMMSAQQYGMYDKMIENIIEFSGHLQVQDSLYTSEKTINHSIAVDSTLLAEIEQTPHITNAAPRLESFALASYNDKTKGAAIIGIDIQKEQSLSGLQNKVIKYTIPANYPFPAALENDAKHLRGMSYISEQSIRKNLEKVFPDNPSLVNNVITRSATHGQYLQSTGKGVLVGEKLAQYLGLTLGDTLVLISQGYHGVSAAGLYPVHGLLKLPLAELERRVVFMNLAQCQYFYGATNRVSSLAITVDADKNKQAAEQALMPLLPGNFAIETWEEAQPEMVQMIESDKAGGVFMKGIFYMIISFIIFGTIVMVIAERRREFAVMISVGMHKSKLLAVLFWETLYVSLLGTGFGLLLSFPVVRMLHENPIPMHGEMAQMMEDFGFEAVIYFSNAPAMFYRQAIIVFIIAMLVYIFPVFKIQNLNVIKALRG